MLSEILDGLSKIFGAIATTGKVRRELKETALRSISTALDETCIYYRDIEKGMKRDAEREAMLVRYWSAAAIPIRHFDAKLAQICDLKSEFWINPEHYNERDIKKLGIRLDDVRQAYRNMLRPFTFRNILGQKKSSTSKKVLPLALKTRKKGKRG